MDFYDPYENISLENVIYTTENIPTAETEDKFSEIFAEGCNCENLCNLDSNCSCLKSSINYNIADTNNLNHTRETLHTKYFLNPEKSQNGLYECNINCKCTHTCTNRLAQYGPINYLDVRNSDKKGFGLFTSKQILKGNFICEYAGEVITTSEASKRFESNKEKNLMNYIICVQEHFGQKLHTTFIDPSYFGNIGRFLNHSCKPNCELVPVRVNNLIPKLCIFAKNDISVNSELTFDYGDGNTNLVSNDKIILKECLCNENVCRKWMPYNANIAT